MDAPGISMTRLQIRSAIAKKNRSKARMDDGGAARKRQRSVRVAQVSADSSCSEGRESGPRIGGFSAPMRVASIGRSRSTSWTARSRRRSAGSGRRIGRAIDLLDVIERGRAQGDRFGAARREIFSKSSEFVVRRRSRDLGARLPTCGSGSRRECERDRSDRGRRGDRSGRWPPQRRHRPQGALRSRERQRPY